MSVLNNHKNRQLTDAPEIKSKYSENKNKIKLKKNNNNRPANHNARLLFAATCRWKRPRVGRSLLPRANDRRAAVGARVLLAGLLASVRGMVL